MRRKWYFIGSDNAAVVDNIIWETCCILCFSFGLLLWPWAASFSSFVWMTLDTAAIAIAVWHNVDQNLRLDLWTESFIFIASSTLNLLTWFSQILGDSWRFFDVAKGNRNEPLQIEFKYQRLNINRILGFKMAFWLLWLLIHRYISLSDFSSIIFCVSSQNRFLSTCLPAN